MTPKQAAYHTIKKLLTEERQRRGRIYSSDKRRLQPEITAIDDALKALELLKPEAINSDQGTLF